MMMMKVLLLIVILLLITINRNNAIDDNTNDNNTNDNNTNNDNTNDNDNDDSNITNNNNDNTNTNSSSNSDNIYTTYTNTNSTANDNNDGKKPRPSKVKKTKVTKARVSINNTIDDNIKKNKTRNDYEEEFLREKEEREKIIEEANRRRAQLAKEEEGKAKVKRLLQDSSSDTCDWLKQPLSIVGGEVCGAHYKVLGLKKRQLVTKTEIKKAYRQKSLSVHPDKNPSKDASEAFKVVQDAYECLVDDACRAAYDYKLEAEEESIMIHRKRIKDKVVRASLEGLSHLYYYVSVAASRIYGAAIDIWTLAGEWEVLWLGEPRPIGRYLLGLILAWKGQPLLQLTAISYGILRINQELIKRRGLFD